MAKKGSSIEVEYQRLRRLPENKDKPTSELVSLIVQSEKFDQVLINAWVAHRRAEQLRRNTQPIHTN